MSDSPDDRASLERQVRRLQQKLTRAEANLRRLEDQREGSALLHAAIVKRLEASHGELAAKNAELQAVTRQLEASERLATQASRAKSTFLANMSHELRTPLNAIIGYAELLQETLDDLGHDVGRTELGRVRLAGRHLLDLINQILDLSKVEAGKMKVDLAVVELEQLVEELRATIAPAADRKGLELRFHVRAGRLRTDPQKLSQILLNLLSNGVKFTDRGWVELDVVDVGSGVSFTVGDSGIGMSIEQQVRAFQPFEQADPSTTRRYGGTGLGLAISERFCALIGGRLTLNSSPGRGARFSFTLPKGA
ncbi:MAG: ATP-binding protein [Myxococcota bacterium]